LRSLAAISASSQSAEHPCTSSRHQHCTSRLSDRHIAPVRLGSGSSLGRRYCIPAVLSQEVPVGLARIARLGRDGSHPATFCTCFWFSRLSFPCSSSCYMFAFVRRCRFHRLGFRYPTALSCY